jgi:hypothetical protein
VRPSVFSSGSRRCFCDAPPADADDVLFAGGTNDRYIRAFDAKTGSAPARMQARLNLVRPHEFPDVPQGGAIWFFALE